MVFKCPLWLYCLKEVVSSKFYLKDGFPSYPLPCVDGDKCQSLYYKYYELFAVKYDLKCRILGFPKLAAARRGIIWGCALGIA